MAKTIYGSGFASQNRIRADEVDLFIPGDPVAHFVKSIQ
jgi:hypothetical protein